MPFRPNVFRENIQSWIDQAALEELEQVYCELAASTTPQKKAHCIHELMGLLDRELDEPVRRVVMEACGRQCIGASTLNKARKIQGESRDFDDLLRRLNGAHIGGGHLSRDGEVVFASYDRCYCGSVSKTKETFSATYCRCSCGWFRQLFETLLGKPVEVELAGSIIQGDERCRFLIHT